MPKRFTDTDKWRKHFIKNLPPEYKVFWLYVLDDCDHCGIWHVDYEVAEIRTGVKLSAENAGKYFSEKIIIFDSGNKWLIPDFITFQYGEQLVLANRMHKPVIDKLIRYDLLKHINCEIVNEGTSKHAIRHRVTKKVKDRILLRDDLTCAYCSLQLPREELVVDHIMPIIKGGDSCDGNLTTSCVRCNSYKSDLSVDEFFQRSHDFLNPKLFIKNLLNGANKKLLDPKEKEQEQGLDKDSRENCSIEHCAVLALQDERWVRVNKASEKLLMEFNVMLEKQGVYRKIPIDYKTHYANWRKYNKPEQGKKINYAATLAAIGKPTTPGTGD
jgi:hypothetical protein